MDWLELLDRLGVNTTRLRWRLYEWERRRADARRERVSIETSPALRIPTTRRQCPECRALVDEPGSACPYCGARILTARAARVQRVLGLMAPEWHPVAAMLLLACTAVLGVGIFLFGPAETLLPDTEVLRALGALVPAAVMRGEWHQLITWGFMHIGPIHYIFNMLSLSQVGPFLEKEIGSLRLLVVYVVVLAAAGLIDVAVRGPVPVTIAGASGAIFGLIGFGAAYGHRRGGAGRTLRDFFLHWAAYGFVFGLAVGADNIAHAGGFAAGAVLGILIEWETRTGRRNTAAWAAAALACTAATIAAFVRLIAG